VPIPRSALTPEQWQALVDDITATAGTPEGSVRRIAARHDVSMRTVRTVAAEAGLADAWASGRARTAAAAQARTVTAAERRAWLLCDLLDDIDELRERMFDDVTVPHPTMGTVTIPAGPADLRNIATAVGILVDKHVQLARLEVESTGSGQAAGLLEQLEASLRAARLERETRATQSDEGSVEEGGGGS